MISHRHKFIFISIPKSGCTSIEYTLKPYAHPVLQGFENWHSIYFKHACFHKIIEEIKTEEINNYFKFAFVRNPYDWLVSNYTFNRGVHAPYIDVQVNRLLENKQQKIYSARDPEENFKYLRKKMNPMNFTDWVKYYTRNINATQIELIESIDTTISLDFIGRFENFQQDFDIVCEKIGIPSQQLPYKNATKHKHYTEYYDEETKQIVAEKYAKDIEYFGYKFGE